jgi:penicillin amidase
MGVMTVLLVSALFVAAVTAPLVWLVTAFRRSRPILEGVVAAPALEHDVRVERDADGVPVIDAESRTDAAYALGFLHAQERLFQMDTSRRIGAGELAELFGAPALTFDRMLRPFGCRRTAEAALAAMTEPERALLVQYTRGVNRGREALAQAPFEYGVLRTIPAPWLPEDSLLVVASFYVLLQLNLADQKVQFGRLAEVLPGLAEFVAPLGTEWDSPLRGAPIAPGPIPDKGSFDARRAPPRGADFPLGGFEAREVRGSNNWALSGQLTKSGQPLLANDLHLQFSVPNTFYRASLGFTAEGATWRVTGITAPGYPLVLAGSNGSVSWGLTNAPGDVVNVVRLDQADCSEGAFRTSSGECSLHRRTEVLRVRGGKTEDLTVEGTDFGPVTKRGPRGERYVHQWVAGEPLSLNLRLRGVETARTAAGALDFAKGAGIPHQNFVAADSSGNIGWTVAGSVPLRGGTPSRAPASSSDEGAIRVSYLDRTAYPMVMNPPGGVLWTANARTVDGDDLEKLGHGYYVLGARAGQIARRLASLRDATELDLLGVQLDDRADFVQRWKGLMLSTLNAANASFAGSEELRQTLLSWDGRASAESVAYRLVRSFRDKVDAAVFAPVVAAVSARYPDFDLGAVSDQREGPLWALVTARPLHFLNAAHETWEGLFAQAARDVLREARRLGSISSFTWGRANRLSMRHPLSKVLPVIGWFLDMQKTALSGDAHMPLAQLREHGPVVRFVVSPSREAEGVLQMPGGQAGNPMTPYYGAGHEAWLRGTPRPFLPGPCKYSLVLQADSARSSEAAS